ncbi:hypothetical protein L364_00310 [Klebsiella pneumoniae MGH 18]|nr:hypothetical protein L364_00310 [Klebsiella pneumoniae MGH 18]
MKLTDVAIVAVEGFSPFHYAVPCMLFGDSVSEIKRFNLHICAERPGLLRARDGFALYATGDYAALEQADIVVVPYWGEVDRRPPQALLDSLVRARDNGAEIVGLCLGAFVLGYAGLLDGRRAATHWEFEQGFQRRFRRCSWISTRCTSTTSGSLLRRAPRRRWTVASTSSASVSAASRPTRSPGG